MSLVSWRQSSTSCAIGTPSRDSRSSSVTSVDQVPDLPLRPPGRPILLNRMSPSCCGLPMVNLQPASPQICSSSAAIWALNSADRLVQHVAVDLDAVALHRADHRDHRPVDQLVDPGRLLERQPRRGSACHSRKRDVGILGGIFGRLVERHLVEGDLLLPGAAQLLEGDAVVVEMLLGEIVQRVAVEPAGVEVEAHHQSVVIGRDADAALVQHHPVELEVVADLEHRRILEQRLQLRSAPAPTAAGRAARRTCRRRHARAGCSRPCCSRWRG